MPGGHPSKLVIFGDSLSDAGNAFALSGQVVKVPIPPASAGYNGWFSNGLVQSEVTADLLGAPTDNYAVGGARAVGSRTVAEYLEQNDYDTPEIMLPDPDPVTLASVTLLLVLVALAASWLPARWASGVDPLGALK